MLFNLAANASNASPANATIAPPTKALSMLFAPTKRSVVPPQPEIFNAISPFLFNFFMFLPRSSSTIYCDYLFAICNFDNDWCTFTLTVEFVYVNFYNLLTCVLDFLDEFVCFIFVCGFKCSFFCYVFHICKLFLSSLVFFLVF